MVQSAGWAWTNPAWRDTVSTVMNAVTDIRPSQNFPNLVFGKKVYLKHVIVSILAVLGVDQTYGMMQYEATFSQKLNILSTTLESSSSSLPSIKTINSDTMITKVTVFFADLAY